MNEYARKTARNAYIFMFVVFLIAVYVIAFHPEYVTNLIYRFL